ncbi:MAG: helix-turn-helix domain-containing protein [Geodermatophilaceae bacterium]|nr:helix-turn-helix domain-containing protein [Geodermatophilaceae bacterium]
MPDDFVEQVSGVSALAEPARRALYLYVVAQPAPVSRDQAAAGAGLPRHTAKFHLDKLVDEGLLDTEFRRLSGRRGPGAGRPSKLYRRSSRQVSVTLPERHYDLAGHILACAVEQATGDGASIQDALGRAAADAGRQIGGEAQHGSSGKPSGRQKLQVVADVLAAHGYEPRVDVDTMVLSNCPFDALAKEHTELVCGVNLDLITAAVEELGFPDVTARLDPSPERCCVVLRRQAG